LSSTNLAGERLITPNKCDARFNVRGEPEQHPSGPASGGAGPAAAAGPTKIERKQLLILLVLSLSLAIIVIDATIVIVAQYQIQKDFGISLKDLEWITSLYALIFGSFLSHMGKTKR